MAVPRHEILTPDEPTYYHCYSRCVRRAFLCGHDSYSGRCFEHRREWVSRRLTQLLDVFAMDQAAFSVMMNHLHTVLRTRPDLAEKWSDEEVARRWRTLFPRRKTAAQGLEPSEEEIQAITRDKELVERYRQRLSSISWFHRCLNEHIARKANKEDDCKGRFWEGRFRSERLESDAAVIACAVYVDLNPIRARLAETPEESDFTSIQLRIRSQVSPETQPLPRSLIPVSDFSGGKLSDEEYLSLVDETGRCLKGDKGTIPEELAPILTRLGLKPNGWLRMTREKKKLFHRVIGSATALQSRAKRMGKQWLHGLTAAQIVFA